ncbi:unnamed protein product, partial [Iphiclides podalirius]
MLTSAVTENWSPGCGDEGEHSRPLTRERASRIPRLGRRHCPARSASLGLQSFARVCFKLTIVLREEQATTAGAELSSGDAWGSRGRCGGVMRARGWRAWPAVVCALLLACARSHAVEQLAPGGMSRAKS